MYTYFMKLLSVIANKITIWAHSCYLLPLASLVSFSRVQSTIEK